VLTTMTRMSCLMVTLTGVLSDSDTTWMGWLNNGFPDAAVKAAAELTTRAEGLVQGLQQTASIPQDVDVVCGGGGNYDGYYMGVSMVLQRAQKLTVHRYAGASAGGMMPFEVSLKGEQETLQEHLAYGMLMDQ